MKALLLAAGLGTRLKPLTEVLPKCMIPIHGRPLLALWLETLIQAGITEIFVNLHYKGEVVRNYVNASPYKNYVTFLEEETLRGTAGTFLTFHEQIATEDLIIAHADNLTLFDPNTFIKTYNERPKDVVMTMMTFETPTPESCGIVQIGAEDRVINFVEKPREYIGSLANAAVYIVQTDTILRDVAGKDVTDFSTQILPLYIGRMNSFHNGLYHRDIGTTDSLRQAQADLESLPAFRPLLENIQSYWTNQATPQNLRNDFESAMAEAGYDAHTKHLLSL